MKKRLLLPKEQLLDAINHNAADKVKGLLSRGNITDYHIEHALQDAAKNGYKDIVAELLIHIAVTEGMDKAINNYGKIKGDVALDQLIEILEKNMNEYQTQPKFRYQLQQWCKVVLGAIKKNVNTETEEFKAIMNPSKILTIMRKLLRVGTLAQSRLSAYEQLLEHSKALNQASSLDNVSVQQIDQGGEQRALNK